MWLFEAGGQKLLSRKKKVQQHLNGKEVIFAFRLVALRLSGCLFVQRSAAVKIRLGLGKKHTWFGLK